MIIEILIVFMTLKIFKTTKMILKKAKHVIVIIVFMDEPKQL